MATREQTLDVRGLLCPLPVLRANKALKPMPGGADLVVLASDAAAPADFRAFCQTTGHALVAIDEDDGTYRIRLRKKV